MMGVSYRCEAVLPVRPGKRSAVPTKLCCCLAEAHLLHPCTLHEVSYNHKTESILYIIVATWEITLFVPLVLGNCRRSLESLWRGFLFLIGHQIGWLWRRIKHDLELELNNKFYDQYSLNVQTYSCLRETISRPFQYRKDLILLDFESEKLRITYPMVTFPIVITVLSFTAAAEMANRNQLLV